MNIIGIIPARYASSRFPGKPLVMIDGKSMIRRVYEQASKSTLLTRVVVATDDERIFKHVQDFGGQVAMTSATHPNGTSRCLEAAQQAGEAFDAVVNIQGDEPYISPAQIDRLAKQFENREVQIATLAKETGMQEELFDPNVVKVVFDLEKNALFFSRQAIPFVRELPKEKWPGHHRFYKHIGIYGYRFDVLEKIVGLSPSALELTEKLEQLRWLENGFQIRVELTSLEAVSIDTPDDLLKLTNST